MYDWLLFLHILAAMVWLGGLAGLTVFGTLALRGDDSDVARFSRSLRRFGPILLAPSAVLVVALGIPLVAKSAAWDFGQRWVDVALALVVVAVLVGAVSLARTALAAERAVADGDAAAARRQLVR